MDLDLLLIRYFATDDPDTLDDAAIDAGCEAVLMDLAKEVEPGRRFALWALLAAFDSAPAPSATFKDPAARKAAEDYARALAQMADDD